MKGVSGVGGGPVRVLEHRGLRAVVSPVSLAEFGEEGLRRNLEDLRWLESTARAHHAVVDAAVEFSATIPLGLATVYRGEDRVRGALNEKNEEFTRALDRITGRTEWGVKVYADVRPAAPETTGEEPAASSPGTSYLRRRRMQQDTAERTRNEVMDVAERVHDELAGIAAAVRLHRPQDPQLSGECAWMIFNAAYLVDDSRSDDFQAAVRRLGGLAGIRLQLTGPWAPYSFAAEEETTWTEL
jgi:hypothetical protein